MGTQRLTVAQAIVAHLIAQTTELGDGSTASLFPGVYGIFGHGNVTCLGHALEERKDELPTWRGQNEQGMALAATAHNKAVRRRQIMTATSSIGPGATNMVTAAGVAHSNRLPLLLLAGDTFASRTPDPVLQQVEHFGVPSTTVNDSFRPVARYWDRITMPDQLLTSLPQAIDTMLDPADCGPAFLGLPQDVQAMAFDVPDEFVAAQHHWIVRARPDRGQLAAAVDALRSAKQPLILAGGGVHYSFAEAALLAFAERHRIPVVETVAGKASLVAAHELNAGPIGVTGCESANALAAQADVVLAVGSRLEDFTTGSWTLFQHPDVTIIGLNAARFDARKRRSLPLVADARVGLEELTDALGDWVVDVAWTERAATERAGYHAYVDEIAAPSDDSVAAGEPVTYAQVVGAVDRNKQPGDYVLAAAGGFPGEVNNGWRAEEINSFDCEYGFSCMGYEIAGGWGAKMAMPDREVIVFVGDGSTMMLNSDLYSSVIGGHKMIVIICDNGGYAVINRLQINQGGVPFNNLLDDCKGPNTEVRVDFEMLAKAQGCNAETVHTVTELESAMDRARASDRTYVIALQTHRYEWTEGGTYWEVGVPEVSNRPSVVAAHDDVATGKQGQRRA
ncbi:3D-(3,5/4)-trihydroxycyclohexane-1,2-dione acylhydrolase (decyclizing) [uncultured Ilumatobacter sp.]|uniref:3D-(3,5/4)-trihydroxycyclohexane-1,2-dione acylhydrolase (decyclizing) n=1 Tax=uncultured Ilumatobacter sp. TaxID=879968 RepID=UPI00374FBE29